MTTTTDITNDALQLLGTRTTVASLAEQSNEAIQANLIINSLRDQLLRMAPWNCSFNFTNPTIITAAPGTPENTSAGQTLWAKGLPPPPWAYEYQYPVDCLRACWLIPATQTGFAGGVPITTAVTGGAASFWQGPPVKFKVQNDQFFPVTAAAPSAPGSGHAIGDVITLAAGASTSPPIGAPAQLLVTGIGGGGSITSVSVVAVVADSNPAQGGSYFAQQANPVSQGSTTGVGTGASFTLTYGSKASQKVILTNQEFASLTYVERVADPNLMDTLFQSAWTSIVASTLAMALTGDKKLANFLIDQANKDIEAARNPDGNEGLSIADVTPDWLRIRGIDFAEPYSGPYTGFDWGGMWPTFG